MHRSVWTVGLVSLIAGCSANPTTSFREDQVLPDGSAAAEGSDPGEVEIPASVLRLAAGAHHTCASLSNDRVVCIGDVPSRDLHEATRRVVHELAGVDVLVAGDSHTCALLEEGTVACWGDNRVGQLGDGTTTRRDAPAPVMGLSGVTAISARGDATCVIGDGGVSCWGALGRADDRALEPTPIELGDVVEIAVGRQHVCGRTFAGDVACWGDNSRGQHGAGEIGDIAGVTHHGIDDAIAIVAGSSHTCVARGPSIEAGGIVECWGGNGFGQLGDGTTFDSATRVRAGELDRITMLVAGEDHTCARTAEGTMHCWGRNHRGQVGVGTQETQRTPLPPLEPVETMAAGRSHTCALQTGRAMCWGENSFGQLGDGSTEDRVRPVIAAAL